MAGFIDVHTHILYSVDDGAKDLEDSLALIKFAKEEGTEKLILTPHYRGIYKENTPTFLKDRFNELLSEVKKQNLDIDIYLGAEVHYEMDAPKLIYEKKILSLNDGNYVLLEFSNHSSKESIIRGISEVIRYGYIPIIAHIERYEIMRKDKHLVDEVLQMGAYIQVNADDILDNGSIKRFCLKLLKNHKVHFVGSDAHNLETRTPSLKKAYNFVGKKYGYKYANEIFHDNAMHILENTEL